MIAWTKLVVTAAWVMSASLGCAGATPKPSAPRYFRSPPLDYADGPRSASDGELLGAQDQSAEDGLEASATNEHPGPGWGTEYGRLRFERERVVGGHGVSLATPLCEPPEQGPLPPEEAQARAALRQAWLRSERSPSLPMLSSIGVEVPDARPPLLSCSER
jgi:hypothetical protein